MQLIEYRGQIIPAPPDNLGGGRVRAAIWKGAVAAWLSQGKTLREALRLTNKVWDLPPDAIGGEVHPKRERSPEK